MVTNNAVNTNLNGQTGTGNFVGANTPTLITPVLGAALATSVNFGGSSLSNYVSSTSWVPVLTSSGGGTATYSTQTGNYIRIGNLVFFDLTLILTGLPSAGDLSITGLPINIGSTFVANTFANALQATMTSPANTLALSGGSIIYLQKYATGTYSSLTVADCTATSQFYISGCYSV